MTCRLLPSVKFFSSFLLYVKLFVARAPLGISGKPREIFGTGATFFFPLRPDISVGSAAVHGGAFVGAPLPTGK